MGRYFNEEQEAHMAWLATIPPNERCWCGWDRLGDCSNCNKSHAGKTRIDRHEAERASRGGARSGSG